jgi:putative membrane protein
MAIDRTLLAFVRTSLYFAIAGMTINSLLNLSYGWYLEIAFWIIALLIFFIGIYKFYHQKQKLRNNRKHIGNYAPDDKSRI